MGIYKYYWMAVTPDEYELPLAVADSAQALANLFGISKETIECSAWRGANGKNSGRKFVRVEREVET